MNKIDEIRAKLEGLCWENDFVFDSVCTLPKSSIDPILKIIAPYLSHGITEEEAWKWFSNAHDHQSYVEFLHTGKEFGFVASSREPIAEPEESLCANCARKGVDCKGFFEKVIDCPNRIQKE